MIVIDHLTKTYTGRGEVTAVDDVSLTIPTGEIFGILGRSGAGKSTLLRCLNLLERPSSGTITIDGVDLAALPGHELRVAPQKIGTVFQHFNLLHARTVLDNIAFPLEVLGIDKRARVARARELAEFVGLGDRLQHFPSQLSGGQKQRVGIARALVSSPSVLLCDEATSALDPSTTEQILDLIADINAKTGVTVVLITHESEVVRRICSSAALMADGRVVEAGNLLDLLTDPESRLAEILLPTGAVNHHANELILSFAKTDAHEPVFSHLTRDLNVDVTILGGSVETISGHQVGRLRVAFAEPMAYVDEEAVRRYLIDRGVTVSRA